MLGQSGTTKGNAQRTKGAIRAQETLQAGAICHRRSKQGHVEVLLVASLRNGRWGLPKGHVNAGETTSDAALREAFEEAGIRGTATPRAFGNFIYYKQDNPKRYCVSVHLVAVSEVLEEYPERHIRKCKWVSLATAAREASRSDLRIILEDFRLMMAGRD
jgi:8-oxo-dGTP pyrophosphatase MutT (NUDIX family)